jgi:hypothetical protein
MSDGRTEREGPAAADDPVRGSGLRRRLGSQLAPLQRLLRAERSAVLGSLGLIAAGALFISRGTPLWWFGAAALVGATVCLWHTFSPQLTAAGVVLSRERRWLGRSFVLGTSLLDVVYIAALIWVATFMMRDVIHGVRPISHDHTVHYFKAWQLHEYFLPHLRLHGFSHRWFAGYPVNYLYPVGTDLFVNLVHYAGLGLVPFSRSYGLAFWLFHILTGYAGYRLGRALGGPHVGLICGFLMITDLSAFRFGGWAYTIEYGVWPQALSLVFALLATVRLPAIYQTRALRPVGVFALYMGAAIVTHPIELIYLGVLLLAAVLAGLFTPGLKTAHGTARLLVAYALSCAIAAFWLLPFMASGSQTTPMGVWWDSTYELGKGLISLDAFPGTLGYVLALGMLACVVMLRSRRFVLLVAALMALLVPALSNSSFIDELHLPQLSASFSKIQWLRMSTMVKPFWFAIAGFFVVTFLRKAREMLPTAAPPHDRSRLREVVLAMVVSFLALPFAIQAGESFFTANIAKAVVTESERALDQDRANLLEWLRHNLPNDGFYRICVSTGHNHDLLDLGTELSHPIYKRGFTPAENFIYKMNTEDNAVLEAVNVRYTIAKKWLPPEDYRQIVQFGIYSVYEFKHWKPQPYVITQGHGDVTIESFGDEEIDLRAAPGSSGRLRLNVSYFPRWHAYRDGKRISLWPTALPEAPTSTGFMTVDLAPGQYRFVFEPSALDESSWVLSLFGIAVGLAFAWGGRLRGNFKNLERVLTHVGDALEQLSEPRLRWLRRVSFGLFAAAAIIALWALAQWRPPLALENLDGALVKRVRFDFLEELASAHVDIEYPSRVRRCRRLGDRFACRNEDGNVDNEKYVASTPAEIEEYRMVRCIRARPIESARLVLNYPEVPIGDAIVGYFGVERAGRMMRLTRPVDFQVAVDGEPVYAGATVSDNKMHWFKAPVGGPPRTAAVTFTVSSPNVQRRFFCFYAQMADLGSGPASAPPTRRSVGEAEDEAR